MMPTLRRRRQENQRFKAILGYIENSRPAWVTGVLASKINKLIKTF